MVSFWINPGSLLRSKDFVYGSGQDFNQVILKDEILLFLKRTEYPGKSGLFVYCYVQKNKTSCIICPEEKFYRFFDVVYFGNIKANVKNSSAG